MRERPLDPAMVENEMFIKTVLERFTYRPCWKFGVDNGYLRISARVIDANEPSSSIDLVFSQPIPPYVYRDFNWTRWLFDRIKEIEFHELQEFFRIDGRPVYEPHPELVELKEFEASGRAKIPHDQR